MSQSKEDFRLRVRVAMVVFAFIFFFVATVIVDCAWVGVIVDVFAVLSYRYEVMRIGVESDWNLVDLKSYHRALWLAFAIVVGCVVAGGLFCKPKLCHPGCKWCLEQIEESRYEPYNPQGRE